jgi:hypothetical protein
VLYQLNTIRIQNGKEPVSESYMSKYIQRCSDYVTVPKKPVQPERDAAATYENVVPMYYDWHYLLDTMPEVFDYRLLYNGDEVNVVLDESSRNAKVVTRLDNYDDEVLAGPRYQTTTLFFNICANGNKIPPVLISKAKTPNDEYEVVYLFMGLLTFIMSVT